MFTLYSAWENASDDFVVREAPELIARGEDTFNTRTAHITNVAGLNAGGPEIDGTCTTCHDTPNVGNHSLAPPLDIAPPAVQHGSSSRLVSAGLSSEVRRRPAWGETFTTTDFGRSLIRGQCADISKVKGPILHAFAARAPYFRNGSATTLSQLVDFHDRRFTIGISAQDTLDLIAFREAR